MEWWLGYAGIGVAVGFFAGVLTAPLGASAAHRLPTKRLKQVYAVGLYFLYLSA